MFPTPVLDSLQLHKRFVQEHTEQLDVLGRLELSNILARYGLQSLPKDWDYRLNELNKPTLVRRISAYYHEHGTELTALLKTQIGNLCNLHSARIPRIVYDFDRDLKWNDGDFGDEGSCFWGGRNEAIAALRKHGAVALRVWENTAPDGWWGYKDYPKSWYKDESNKNWFGVGRCWIVEAPSLPKDSLLLFNAYGQRHGLGTLAGVMARHLNYDYGKTVSILNNGTTDGQLYLNGGTAWLIGTKRSIMETYSIDLKWEFVREECLWCGRRGLSANMIFVEDEGGYSCKKCFPTIYTRCHLCKKRVNKDDVIKVMLRGKEISLCYDCDKPGVTGHCEECGKLFLSSTLKKIAGEKFCPSCATEFRECHKCHEVCDHTEKKCPYCGTHRNTTVTNMKSHKRKLNEGSARPVAVTA